MQAKTRLVASPGLAVTLPQSFDHHRFPTPSLVLYFERLGNMNDVTVAVISPATTTAMDIEISSMVAEVLADCGTNAIRLADGDTRCLEADVVLLVGDCLEFDGTADLLREAGNTRPRTALWQLHALPPPDLPAAVVASGLRVTDVLRQVQTQTRFGPMLVKARGWIPPKLRVVIRSILYRGVRREASRSPSLNRWHLDEASRQFMLMRYGWLRRRVPEGWLDVLCMSTAPRVAFLQANGMSAECRPFGYHPTFGTDLGVMRDIDVLFLGRAKIRRRQALLEQVDGALSTRGRRMLVVGGKCFGQARTDLLNRAKISLNLTNYPWEVPGIRFVMSMACGAVVVSEQLGEAWPFRDGTHFASARSEELPEVILRLLDDDAERSRLRDAGRAFVTQDLRLAESVAGLLRSTGVGVESRPQ